MKFSGLDKVFLVKRVKAERCNLLTGFAGQKVTTGLDMMQKRPRTQFLV